MREAIGGNWLFNIVIFFVILFTGYLCLSINHTKAFNVKDDIVKIPNGKEDQSLAKILIIEALSTVL